ncbi:tRNA 5-methoxyuridine(34)/uridine 5-oxyacetic acid(34) synthase CmoB [Sulfurospirillum sp. 1612]|uniref:tRNA 5-methoxyuridine(34)/uridine 5-oxyacetic acid(34) synthase CmoB n=1 Tax=Sulfurospirillum sp. 1612 TaxID=3094835 RepID=UPI002F945F28
MDLNTIRKEREKWNEWKNIKPLREHLAALPNIQPSRVSFSDIITLEESTLQETEKKKIDALAWMLRPWRKGPFNVFGTFIDSEWQSQIKYNLLEPYLDLKDKCVADIGCNNGYYLFRMLEQHPKKLVGFDPSIHYKTQFDFINHFIKAPITYELLGIEHVPFYETRFDVIFCLGVLYHRSDPISALKALKKGLNPEGEVILDTFIIDGDAPMCLTPQDRYSKIPNIYFIPTVTALQHWCQRAGFRTFELLCIKKTDLEEQRKTKWIEGESLDNFLDPNNHELTIEGYPAPKRAYVKIRI